MNEMKTLNGYEIVDAKAREDIETLKNSGVDVDLTGYYTKEETDALIPDVSGYQTETQVNALITTALNNIGVAEGGSY